MSFFGPLRLKIRNLDLWAKIIILIVSVLLCLFLVMSYFSWQILSQQHGQERRVKKLFAAEQSLLDEINQMGLVAKLLASHVRQEEGHSLELADSKAQRRVLKALVDSQFVFLFDKNGQIISAETEGLTLKQGYRFQVEQLAQGGRSAQAVEVYPEGTFQPQQNTPGMVIIAASPIMEGKNVKAVLVVGNDLGKSSNFVLEASRQLQVLVSLYYQGHEISSANNGKVTPKELRNVLTRESYFNYLDKGQPFYSTFTVGESKYLSSAQPLKDNDGNVIGALFVGQPQEPINKLFQAFMTRFAVLSVVALLIGLVFLNWVYRQVNRPLAALVKGASKITKGDLTARIKTDRLLACWELRKCHKTTCQAYGNREIPCWYIGREDCPCTSTCQSSDKWSDSLILGCCQDCTIFLSSKGNQLEQLADGFNFMTVTLEKKQKALTSAFQELQAQNEELFAQQEELVAQQEILVTQQDDLLCVNKEFELALEELDSSHNVIYTLVLALEARDHYTGGHSERVAMYAVKLAQAIGLTEDEQEQIKRASILHDLGKIGISDAILGKPGRLDYEEMKLVQEHPVIGERICQPLKTTADLLPIIRHHHEWVNGQGYPDGLQGENIPLEARILAVADAFDAMTSSRPYRKKGLTKAQAVEILKDGAGVQWDAHLVKAFVNVVEEEDKQQEN